MSALWESVNKPEQFEQKQEYFGEISISAWECMLVSGMGAIPYDERDKDPKTSQPYRKFTAITLTLVPLEESGLQYDITRTLLAQFGDWKDTVWPSLRLLGIIDASTLNDKYAHVELVKTGTYTKNGQTKDSTTFKFLAVFKTREDCVAAWEQRFNEPNKPADQPPPWEEKNNGDKPNGNERATALKFATVYIKNAVRQGGGDLEKIRAGLRDTIAKQPLISKHFTIDSPEIVDALMEEMAK